MACSNDRSGAFPARQQIPPPPCMNTSCRSCGNNGVTYSPTPRSPEGMPTPPMAMPQMPPTMPNMMPGEMPMGTMTDSMYGMPVGMAYVPWQQWTQTYPIEQAMSRGTLFPELDYPFMMGGCR